MGHPSDAGWALLPALEGPVGERLSLSAGRHYRIPPHGRPVPSVTTVLACVAKPALDRWLDRQEGAHRDAALRRTVEHLLYDAGQEAPSVPSRGQFLRCFSQALQTVRDEAKAQLSAAQIGTLVHDAIAWALRSQLGAPAGPMPDLSVSVEAVRAFAAWSTWWEQAEVMPILVEQFVYSQCHGFAGTLDFVYRRDGRRWLLDWKTTDTGDRKPWPSYYIQLRAYELALAEMGRPVDDCAVVMLPRDGSPAEFYPAPADLSADAFLGALALWRGLQAMEIPVAIRIQ